jgi:hypothetical protein
VKGVDDALTVAGLRSGAGTVDCVLLSEPYIIGFTETLQIAQVKLRKANFPHGCCSLSIK